MIYLDKKEAEKILFTKFNFRKFEDNQWNTIGKLLNGERVLFIEKRNYDKSICYKYASIILNGITIVFTPFISTIEKQLQKIKTKTVQANYIYSKQTIEERNHILQEVKQGLWKLLYISPESIHDNELFESILSLSISLVVVEESHCISIWGHDFRRDFKKKVINFVVQLPKELPVLAITSTVTKRVEKDLFRLLEKSKDQTNIGFTKKSIIKGDLLHENFKLFVIKVNSEDEKMIWIAQNIDKFPGTGLLYTGCQLKSDKYTKWFKFLGISCFNKNNCFETEQSEVNVDYLIEDNLKCIVSADEKDIPIEAIDFPFIFHVHVPLSLLHYYQDISRAGKNDDTAYIILFYNENCDNDKSMTLINECFPPISIYENMIEILKSNPLSEVEIIQHLNIDRKQFLKIKEELCEKGIIKENFIDQNSKYEFIIDSQPLNFKKIDELREYKIAELNKMIDYANAESSRTQLLHEYLNTNTIKTNFKNCDNTSEKKLIFNLKDGYNDIFKKFLELYPNNSLY